MNSVQIVIVSLRDQFLCWLVKVSSNLLFCACVCDYFTCNKLNENIKHDPIHDIKCLDAYNVTVINCKKDVFSQYLFVSRFPWYWNSIPTLCIIRWQRWKTTKQQKNNNVKGYK